MLLEENRRVVDKIVAVWLADVAPSGKVQVMPKSLEEIKNELYLFAGSRGVETLNSLERAIQHYLWFVLGVDSLNPKDYLVYSLEHYHPKDYKNNPIAKSFLRQKLLDYNEITLEELESHALKIDYKKLHNKFFGC